MKKLPLILAFALGLGLLVSCDSPENTVKTLTSEIEEFRARPSDQKQMTIDANFAKLDGQIQKLEADGKTAEASLLKSQRSNLRADYNAAKLARSVQDAKNAIEGIGNAFKEAGQSIGEAFRDAATNRSDNSGE